MTRLRKPAMDGKPEEKGYSKLRYGRKKVIDNTEFQEALDNADRITEPYYRLRAKAVLALFRITGKRRGEVAMLPLDNVKREGNMLNITFTLEKKKRKHKKCPNCDMRNPIAALFCKKCGADISKAPRISKSKQDTATKSIPLSDSLAHYIMSYLEYLSNLKATPKFFLPRTYSVFGKGFAIDSEKHLSGLGVFRIVRKCSETIWPHLFRETVASDVIKSDPTIIGAFKVQQRLDLEDIKTGFAYLRRFSTDVIEREKAHGSIAST